MSVPVADKLVRHTVHTTHESHTQHQAILHNGPHRINRVLSGAANLDGNVRTHRFS